MAALVPQLRCAAANLPTKKAAAQLKTQLEQLRTAFQGSALLNILDSEQEAEGGLRQPTRMCSRNSWGCFNS